MKKRGSISLAAAALSIAAWRSGAAAPAQPHDAFQTPAVAQDLFREGEVRHLQGTFKDWRASCDEVTRLKQRFCSLYGKGRAADGSILLGVVITTNDEGKPAAMLEIPLGIRLSSDIEVSVSGLEPSRKAKGGPAFEAPTRLRVVRCSPDRCMTLWRLTQTQIAALNGTGVLQIVFKAPRARYGWDNLSQPAADKTVRASIASEGFRETMRATQTPLGHM